MIKNRKNTLIRDGNVYKSAEGMKSLILRLDLQNCTPITDKYPVQRQHAEVTRQLEESTGGTNSVPVSRLQPTSTGSCERASLCKASHTFMQAYTPESTHPCSYTCDSHWTEKTGMQNCSGAEGRDLGILSDE